MGHSTKLKGKGVLNDDVNLNSQNNSPNNAVRLKLVAIIITTIGIIATLIVQRSATHFIEKSFPKVYFNAEVEEPIKFPEVHLLSDPVNLNIPATLDSAVGLSMTLENDNNTPIYIEDISLVVEQYEEIPRESFLLIKDFYNQGSRKEVNLSTLKPISAFQNKQDGYPLSIVDKETKDKIDGAYLLLESGITDRYSIDVEFNEEGLYTIHFEVNYRIHGKTQTESTKNIRIMHLHRNDDSIKNPETPQLESQIVSYINNEDANYSIYGDGTIDIRNVKYGYFVYLYNEFLLKKVFIEEGIQSIDENYGVIIGPNIKEIYLPSTLEFIRDDTFSNNTLMSDFYKSNNTVIPNPNKKTVFYNGTYSEWLEKVHVGSNNDLLYEYDFVFSDGYKGRIKNDLMQEEDEEKIDGDWKQLYIEYIETDPDIAFDIDWCTCGLIYLDSDDIPELIIDFGIEADGTRIVTFKKDNLDVYAFSRTGGIRYIERKGLVYNSIGHVGEMIDELVYLDDSGFHNYGRGTRYDPSQEYLNYEYFYWNEEEVSEEDYYANIDVFESEKSKRWNAYSAEFQNNQFSPDGICDYLKGYYGS